VLDRNTRAGVFVRGLAVVKSQRQGAQSSYNQYESGAFSAGSLSLGSVLYTDSSTGSYSIGYTSSEVASGYGTDNSTSQGTLTDGGQTGTSSQSDNTSTFSYLITSAETVTASGSGSSSDTEAGDYSAGCFVFTTYIHDESGQDSDSVSMAETLSFASAGTESNDNDGISTGGVNGVFAYTATSNMAESATDNSTDSYSLHESGSNTDGNFNLSCMLYSASSAETTSASVSGNDSSSNTTGYSSNDTYSATENTTDLASASQQGTYSGQSWSISDGSDQENATDNSAFTETIAQSATGQSSLGTATTSSAETYSEYDSYQYGGNSYSFGSLSLSDNAVGSSAYQETGSNATFSSYAESDGDNYTSNLQINGSGQVGTFSESSLESITHTFDGTYTGGGTVHESSLATTGYTNSGTISLATGDSYIPGSIDLPTPMPPELPPLATPATPVEMLGFPAEYGGPSGSRGATKDGGASRALLDHGKGGNSGAGGSSSNGGSKSTSDSPAGGAGSGSVSGGDNSAPPPGFDTYSDDDGFEYCVCCNDDGFEYYVCCTDEDDPEKYKFPKSPPSLVGGQTNDPTTNKPFPNGLPVGPGSVIIIVDNFKTAFKEDGKTLDKTEITIQLFLKDGNNPAKRILVNIHDWDSLADALDTLGKDFVIEGDLWILGHGTADGRGAVATDAGPRGMSGDDFLNDDTGKLREKMKKAVERIKKHLGKKTRIIIGACWGASDTTHIIADVFGVGVIANPGVVASNRGAADERYGTNQEPWPWYYFGPNASNQKK